MKKRAKQQMAAWYRDRQATARRKLKALEAEERQRRMRQAEQNGLTNWLKTWY